MFNTFIPRIIFLLLDGNEVWNSHFDAFFTVRTLANISVLQDGDPYNLNAGLSVPFNVTNLPYWERRYYAWSVLHFAQLASSIVGKARVGRADIPNVRVVPVLGVQGGYPTDGERMLSWLNDVYGPPAANGVATIASGGYISMGPGNTDTVLTTEQVIQGFLGTLANMSTSSPGAYSGNNALAGYTTIAAYYGMDLHAYEASPDTSGSLASQPIALEAKANATQDPRMADIAAGNIAIWQNWGGGTFNVCIFFFSFQIFPIISMN